MKKQFFLLTLLITCCNLLPLDITFHFSGSGQWKLIAYADKATPVWNQIVILTEKKRATQTLTIPQASYITAAYYGGEDFKTNERPRYDCWSGYREIKGHKKNGSTVYDAELYYNNKNNSLNLFFMQDLKRN